MLRMKSKLLTCAIISSGGKRRAIAGSMIGGIAQTQEMLDFCAARDIVADIELIRIDEIEVAFDRMQRSDVKYRVVIDSSTLSARTCSLGKHHDA